MDAPKPGFLTTTVMEVRRTWGGRLGHFWLTAAVLLIGGAGFSGFAGAQLRELSWLDAACFWGLNGLLCWGGAWLGADLIPRGYSAERLLACISGRVLPLYGVVLAGFVASSFCWHITPGGWQIGSEGPRIPREMDLSFPLVAVGMLPAMAFPFFIVAAVLGSASRRPWYLLAVPGSILTGVLISSLPLRVAGLARAGLYWEVLGSRVTDLIAVSLAPNLELSFSMVVLVGGMLDNVFSGNWLISLLALTALLVVGDLLLCLMLRPVAALREQDAASDS